MHNKKKEYIFGILSYAIKRYYLIVCSCHHAHTIQSATNVFNQTRSLLGFSTICRYQFKLIENMFYTKYSWIVIKNLSLVKHKYKI